MVGCSCSACAASSSEVDDTSSEALAFCCVTLSSCWIAWLICAAPTSCSRQAAVIFVDQFGGLLDVGHQLREHGARLLRGLDRFRRQRADLGRRGLAALGELAHFGGDHREAAAVLAGARRLDRRVEREKIGLAGDLLHDGDLVGDGLHRLTARPTAAPLASASWPTDGRSSRSGRRCRRSA